MSEVHCTVLVERTRVVSDPDTLARVEARVLPQAARLTPGQFAGEVAKAIAALDRDAGSRVRQARETRRVWARQLEDGLGALGLIHDWPTIESIMRQVSADGRALQLARRAGEAPAETEPTGTGQDEPADAAGAATVGAAAGDAATGDDELLEDATADACRADAFAGVEDLRPAFDSLRVAVERTRGVVGGSRTVRHSRSLAGRACSGHPRGGLSSGSDPPSRPDGPCRPAAGGAT